MIETFLVSLGATSKAIASAISLYSLSRGAGTSQTTERLLGNLTVQLKSYLSQNIS